MIMEGAVTSIPVGFQRPNLPEKGSVAPDIAGCDFGNQPWMKRTVRRVPWANRAGALFDPNRVSHLQCELKRDYETFYLSKNIFLKDRFSP